MNVLKRHQNLIVVVVTGLLILGILLCYVLPKFAPAFTVKYSPFIKHVVDIYRQNREGLNQEQFGLFQLARETLIQSHSLEAPIALLKGHDFQLTEISSQEIASVIAPIGQKRDLEPTIMNLIISGLDSSNPEIVGRCLESLDTMGENSWDCISKLADFVNDIEQNRVLICSNILSICNIISNNWSDECVPIISDLLKMGDIILEEDDGSRTHCSVTYETLKTLRQLGPKAIALKPTLDKLTRIDGHNVDESYFGEVYFAITGLKKHPNIIYGRWQSK